MNYLEGTVAGGNMTSFLDTITTIVGKMFDYVSQVGQAILADPILTFALGIFAAGAAVGLFSRLLARS